MFVINDYELKLEQCRDLLREAEKERLIRQVGKNQKRSTNQPGIRGLLSKIFPAEKHSPASMSLKNADTSACK